MAVPDEFARVIAPLPRNDFPIWGRSPAGLKFRHAGLDNQHVRSRGLQRLPFDCFRRPVHSAELHSHHDDSIHRFHCPGWPGALLLCSVRGFQQCGEYSFKWSLCNGPLTRLRSSGEAGSDLLILVCLETVARWYRASFRQFLALLSSLHLDRQICRWG